mmetsp:Transcript_6234/g.12254  ORF Transcript_6234/g.12254 Transcript_6234/m.12254 type:complete len:162 (+) Transcript_6234:19-504(+)
MSAFIPDQQQQEEKKNTTREDTNEEKAFQGDWRSSTLSDTIIRRNTTVKKNRYLNGTSPVRKEMTMPDDDGTTTSRWWSTRIPASARAPVLSAMGLMLLGVSMLIAGLVLWQTEGLSALIGVWVCGILVLIPGVYVSRIAYYAYKDVEGYTWADIPDVFRQ